MSIEWHRDDFEGTVWSAMIPDGQEGWFEVQVEQDPAGWGWTISHDRAYWGQERSLEQAKAAVSAQLDQSTQRFPHCEIRPSTENEGGGYLITFSGFPGVVASGATPEGAIRRGRGALEAYHRARAPEGRD
jgi:predicted RNase H-like HicB family nuclease